jgi:nitrate/nitrite transporter NarK
MVYSISGLLYMVAFVLLCFMVREGGYPPPEQRRRSGTLWGWRESAVRFARESFSMGYYWKYYLMNAFFMVGFVPFRGFLQLYAENTLKLNLAVYGKIMGRMMLIQMCVFLVLGPIVDKFHPLRVGLVGYLMMFAAPFASFFLIHDERSFAIWIVATYVAVAVFQGALGALSPRILPRQQYGQFCSANAMVVQAGLLVGWWVFGKYLDFMENYRYIFAWFFCFAGVGAVLMVLVYRQWKQLGGDEAYEPPVRTWAPEAELEVLATEQGV